MAGTEDDMGVFKGLEGDAGLSSHQDLKQQVGGDCGGTMVDCKGIDNVRDDVGGSYVFVGEVNACDPVGDVENCGVVVGTGGNDGGVLAGMGKDGALHGELLVESGSVVVEDGEADRELKVDDQVGLKDERGIGIEDGEVVVGVGRNDCEEKVEDQVFKKDGSGVGVKNGEVVVGVGGNDGDVKVEDQVGLKDETAVTVENEDLVVWDGGNDQDYEVEEDNCWLVVVTEKDVALHGEFLVETGTIGMVKDGKHEDQADFDSTTKLIENRESQTDTDRELGERQEEVFKIMLAHKLSESRTKSVEKSLEHKISVTCSVNCGAHELGEDQAKLKQIDDLANDAKLGESKETGIKSAEASELSDILARVVQPDVIVSPADSGQKFDTGVDVLPDFQISNGDIENSSKDDSTMNLVGSESYADINLESGIQYGPDMPAKDATVAESKVLSGSVNDGLTMLECSSGDSVIGETLGVVAKEKPFRFLIKIPRFDDDDDDDDELEKQMKDAQMLVEEKTTRRDDIGIEIESKRAKLQSIFHKFEATKSDEKAARRSVELKRQEIAFNQDRINKVKNSISVIDINSRIQHMEHMIEHETSPLDEKKQLLHEINTLRKLRDQISSNVNSDNEDNSPFTRIEPMEMQLKTLKKELGDLKAKVYNAEAAAMLLVLAHEYNGEYKKLGELQAQFRAANDVLQDAYKDFLGLERQLHEKSKHYWMYKDEAKTANMKQENIMKPVKSEQVDGKSWVLAESKKKMLKDKTSVKAISESGSVIHIVCSPLESPEILEEKKQQTEEELESGRKADMSRQEEMAAKLKEKLRQEEMAKVQEAVERKRRNAEKAQMRAMLRAQKEAEQKEKEREKRLRKKGKKNTNSNGESGLELETKESPDSPGTKLKISRQCNVNNKPKATAVPPALRNRGKRQLFNHIMCWILGALAILFVLMVVNDSSYRPVKPRTRGDGFSGTNWQPI